MARRPIRPPANAVEAFFQRVGTMYRSKLGKHPFLLFGAPFVVTIVAGSFFLTPATALRYERHNRKVQALTNDDEKGLRDKLDSKKNNKFDIREEYFRLSQRDLNNWEQVRVPRKEGEFNGIFE